jgi:hypothetical protein
MEASDSLAQAVRARAQGRCEYCQLPEFTVEASFHIDHIRAGQHRGATALHNLALACSQCNLHKGTNLAGVDPDTEAIVVLFNPRTDRWSEHFTWRGPMIVGGTPVGRTTIATLDMNKPERVELRQWLIREGLFPPPIEA